MSADAGAYHYHGGWPGIVTPEDPLDVVEEAMRRYDVRWLALESEHIVRSLVPVLTGELRPAWLSDPIAVVPRDEPDTADSRRTLPRMRPPSSPAIRCSGAACRPLRGLPR